MTLGIPRLKELLDQTKQIKTPSNRIFFKKNVSKSFEFASYFASTLPLTRLGDIVSECEIVFDPETMRTVVEKDSFIVEMNNRIGTQTDVQSSRFVIRLILNQQLMTSRRITPPIVRNILRSRFKTKANVISTETNDVEWIVRIRFKKMAEMISIVDDRKEVEGLLCHKIMSIMLDTVAISGHLHIQGAQVTSVGDDEEKEYVVDTMGCNLIDLSAASCVDWYRTTTNDTNEVHACLGLEAAVSVLFSELMTTISFDGTYVDPRHVMLIVNTMTRGGYIMPLSRHGINRMDTGPLLRCSFEETPDILCDAACFGEKDNGHGVSQNIMTGKLPEIGSGCMNLKASAAMMHPRDTVQMSQPERRILKSSVRKRNGNGLEGDMMREFQLKEANSEMPMSALGIEAPFAVSDKTHEEPLEATPQIFASENLQRPFKTSNDMDVEEAGFEKTCMYMRDFKPSSPVSDTD